MKKTVRKPKPKYDVFTAMLNLESDLMQMDELSDVRIVINLDKSITVGVSVSRNGLVHCTGCTCSSPRTADDVFDKVDDVVAKYYDDANDHEFFIYLEYNTV